MNFIRELREEFKNCFLKTSNPKNARLFAIGVGVATLFWGLKLGWYDYYIGQYEIVLMAISRWWRAPLLFYYGVNAKDKKEMVEIRGIFFNYLSDFLTEH